MSDVHPADVALRFLALYSQIQESCDVAIADQVRRQMPALSESLLARLERMTDKERVVALRRLAEDVGVDQNFRKVPDVFYALKELRDTLGHATLLGSDAEDGGYVAAVKGNQSIRLTTPDLLRHHARAWWVFEHVEYVATMAGSRTFDGGQMTRASGALLADTPPPVDPYTSFVADPVVLWEVLSDDTDE